MVSGLWTVAAAATTSLGCTLTRYTALAPYSQEQIRQAFPDHLRFDFKDGMVVSGEVKGRVKRDTAADLLWEFEVSSLEGFRILFEAQYSKADGGFRIEHKPITDSIYPLGFARGSCVTLR
jgi:hypothetical protein